MPGVVSRKAHSRAGKHEGRRIPGGLDNSKMGLGFRFLVDQLRGSWNLLLSWLREVQAWSLAAEVGE
jgi:hypothetical protein